MTRLGAAELLDAAASPWAAEELAGAVPVVVVDLTDQWPTASVEKLDDAASHLRALPAVTMAVVDGVPLSHQVLAEAFDIVLGDAPYTAPGGPEELTDAIAAQPAASVALAQLLRLSSDLEVPDALVAESLVYSTLQAGPAFGEWLAQQGDATADDDPTPTVDVQREGSALGLTLARPERRNAYSTRMRDELVAGLRLAAAEPAIEGVLITGDGECFCAGGDLSEFGASPDPTTGHLTRTTRSAAYWIDRLRRDVRVTVHGRCVGAGVELPAFAGAVLARPDATFRLPEVGMGLVPGAGGTVSIPRRIGRSRAMWLSLSGDEMNATRALGWGLVDRILD